MPQTEKCDLSLSLEDAELLSHALSGSCTQGVSQFAIKWVSLLLARTYVDSKLLRELRIQNFARRMECI